MPLGAAANHLDSFGVIVKSALVAGLAAGLMVATVQFVWTEPIVDRAITLEAQLYRQDSAHAIGAAAPAAEPLRVVDRPTQKKGLFLGYTIYGLAWGLLFGAAYTIAQPHLPARGRVRRSLLLAAASLWAVGLLPFLKYPANPPGVGNPDTIDFRQQIYLGILVGGIVVVALALAGYSALATRAGSTKAVLGGLGLAVAGSTALLLAFPANTDEIRVPLALVTEFRLHSVGGLALFWLLLGGLFAPILRWLETGELRAKTAAPLAANRS